MQTDLRLAPSVMHILAVPQTFCLGYITDGCSDPRDSSEGLAHIAGLQNGEQIQTPAALSLCVWSAC